MEHPVVKRAIITTDRCYRYTLTRMWDGMKPRCIFAMLNPSRADANTDDPTIRRCLRFAKDWQCGSLHVVNLFAYRASKPKDLLTIVTTSKSTAVGQDNNDYIALTLDTERDSKDIFVLAWGNYGVHPKLKWRRNEFLSRFGEYPWQCLEITKEGEPKHPLYCRMVLPRPYQVTTGEKE